MSPGKRILIVTDLWFTHPNGVATFVSNLKRALEKKGHTVDILEPSPFFTIPFFWFYPEMHLALFAGRSVRKKIESGNYDYIHIDTEGFLGLFARNTCLRLGIPFTTTLHGQLWLYAGEWVGKFMERIVIRVMMWFHSAANATLTSTEPVRQMLLSFGLKRVFVHTPGVDDRFFGSGTCPITMLEKPVFLYMGRVSVEKNIEEFLAADLPGTKVVVGGGPDKKRLESKFPSAVFAGSRVGQELIDWCSCGDVMVMPSYTEVFSMAVLECLALGLPVASHDAEGQREVIQIGVNGYIESDIAVAAKKCLSLKRADCRESVRKYSWDSSADVFLSLLEDARKGTLTPPRSGTSD